MKIRSFCGAKDRSCSLERLILASPIFTYPIHPWLKPGAIQTSPLRGFKYIPKSKPLIRQ